MAKQLNVNLAFTANASQAKAELKNLQNSLEQLVNSTALNSNSMNFTKDIQQASAAAAQLKVQLQAATNVNTGNLDLTKFQDQMNKSNMSLEKYQNALYQLGPAGEKAFADLSRSITLAEVPLKRTNSLVNNLWVTLKNTARWQLSSSVLHGFMGAVQSAYGYAQDLNKSLNDIRIVTGSSTDKMAEFAENANKAAKALSTTTTAYTNAALIYYQQGDSASTVLEKTDVTAKMANVTGSSAEEVSDQLTAIWNNFNKSGEESYEKYADILTALGAATASSTDEIAGGLEKFASIADMIGLSYEYAASALATITATTRQSEDVVGTALKTIFARIQGLNLGETLDDGTTLNKYSEALEKVGVSIYDQAGGLKGMDAILNEMGSKWQTLSKDQQVALAQTVAGVRQYNQLVSLMDNWDYFGENLKIAQNAEGALDEQAEIYAESWEAASNRVRASAEAIYDALLNDEFFIELNNSFAELLDGVKVFSDGMGGIKGILLSIGAIVTRVFQKQISESISNVAFSLKMMTKSGQEAQLAQKEKANNLLISGAKDLGTTAGGYKAEVYEALGKNQLNYIENSKRMSQEEQAINQMLMDRNRLLADEVIKKGENVQKLNEQIVVERKHLAIQAQIEAQNNSKSKSHETPTQLAESVKKQQSAVENITKSYRVLETVSSRLELVKGVSAGSEEFKNLKTHVENVTKELFELDSLNTDADFKKLAQALGIADTEAQNLLTTLAGATSFKDLDAALTNIATAAGTKSATAIQGLRDALINCTGDVDKANALMKEYLSTLDRFGPESVEASEALQKLKQAVAGHNTEMDKAKTKPISFSQAITQAASAMMALGQIINQVRGIIDVFNDSEATTGEKILALVTGVGMLVPAIMSLIPAFKATEIAAAEAGTVMAVSMWQVTAIMAGVMALIAVIMLIKDAAHKASPAGVFEAAKKAAEDAATAAEAVKDEYEEIKATLDELDSGLDNIKNLERGTLEWRQAIIESNNSLIDLLSTYGMLDSKNFTTNADGIMEITDEARKQLLEEQAVRVQQATTNEYALKVNKNNAESRLSASDAADDLYLLRGNGQGTYDALGKNSQLSADVGMAIAEAMSQGRIDSLDLQDAEKLSEVLSSVTGLYGDEATQLANQIAQSQELQSAFAELGVEVTAAAEANRLLNNQIVEANYGDQLDASGLDETQQENVADALGRGLEKRAEEIYQQEYKDKGALGGGIEDSVIQKQYAEAMGWATDTIDNQGGNKAKYYAKDGTEIGVISDEVARRYLAQQAAIEEMGGSVDEYINNVSDLIAAGDQIAEGVGQALGTFAGGNGGDLGSLNQNQLDEFKDSITTTTDDAGNVTEFSIGDEVIDEARAQQLGYESVQQYYDAIQGAIESADEALDTEALADAMGTGTSNIVGESFKELFTDNSELESLTASGKQQFADAYKQIFDQGGSDAIGMVDDIIANVSDENKAAAAELIGATDFSNWDSIESFEEEMAKLGVSVDGVDFQNFISEMEGVYGVQKDFNMTEFRELFASIMDIAKELDIGDTISAEDFESLGEGMDQYFTQMADGTYKLTGDAEQFYAAVSKNAKDDLKDSIEANSTRQEELKALKETATDSLGSTGIDKIGELNRNAEANVYNTTTALDQLNFIESMGTANEDQLATWRDALMDADGNFQSVSTEMLEEMAAAASEAAAAYNLLDQQIAENEAALSAAELALFTSVSSLQELQETAKDLDGYSYNNYAEGLVALASNYNNCTQEIEAYNNALMNGTIEEIKAAESTLNASIIVGEAAEKYNLSAEELEFQARALQEVHPELKLTAEQAAKLAIQNQRMNKGIADLADNWKDWKKILTSTNQDSSDYAKTAVALTKTIANLVGATEDLKLSLGFFDKDSGNLELLEQAAQGSEAAINALGLAVAENLVSSLEQVNTLIKEKDKSYIINIPTDAFENFKTKVLSGFTELQNAIANGSVKMGDSLSSILGDENAEEWVNALNTMAKATNMTVDEMNSLLSSVGMSANVTTTEIEQPVKVPVYRTAQTNEIYDDNGKLISYDTKTWQVDTEEMNGIVTVAQIDTGDKPSGMPDISHIKYSGNRGSISSSSTNSQKSSSAKTKKNSKRDIERYHTITKEIEDLNRELSRTQANKDQAFGRAKLPFIQEELQLINKLTEKNAEYQRQLKEMSNYDWSQISVYGFIDANADGILDNWFEVQNRMLNEYNQAVEKFKKDGDEEAFEAAEKRYNDFLDLVEQYEETQEALEDAIDEAAELERERISKELEAITAEVEFEIEINQRSLDKLDKIIDKLNRSTNNMIEIIDKFGEQVGKYGTQSSWYIQGIDRIRMNAMSEGRSLTDEEQRKIWEYQDALDEINAAFDDMIETINNSLLEEFERWNSEIDENIARFDIYSSTIEHYTEIIKLSGRQTKDSLLLIELQSQRTSIAMNELNAVYNKYQANLEAQRNAKEKLDLALISGNAEDIEYWQKQYDEITKTVEENAEEVAATWQDALQAAADEFDFAVETAIQKLNDSISKFGLDGLAERYERAKEVNERYLSDLDKEYELNKLIRQVEGSIDDTDNLNAKRELIKLLDKINAKTAEGVELSQYDLEYMQAEYELELAKLALEEARNAKTSVRLQRDDSGNYSYVYTADQEAIANAEQNYEDKLYAIKKLSADHIQEMSDLIIQNEQEMLEALAAVDRTKFETEEAYRAELQRIAQEYYDKDTYLRNELNKAILAMGATYDQTILGQLEDCATWEQAQEQLRDNTNIAIDSMASAWTKWKENTEMAMEMVGTSADDLTYRIQTDADAIGDATAQLTDTIGNQTEQMKDYINSLIQKIWEWRDTYLQAIRDMQNTNSDASGINSVDFDPNTDYSSLIADYLAEGYGSVGDAVYQQLLAQRNAKIAWLKTQGYDSSYWGTEGADTDAMFRELFSGGGDQSWYRANYWTDEELMQKLKELGLIGFNTGGYTGAWGPEGKLAYLHEKELVLNPKDTENILYAVDVVRSISKQLEQQAELAAFKFGAQAIMHTGVSDSQTLQVEQDVTIHAEFPNATDQNEIKEAILGLVNYTAQYVATR